MNIPNEIPISDEQAMESLLRIRAELLERGLPPEQSVGLQGSICAAGIVLGLALISGSVTDTDAAMAATLMRDVKDMNEFKRLFLSTEKVIFELVKGDQQ